MKPCLSSHVSFDCSIHCQVHVKNRIFSFYRIRFNAKHLINKFLVRLFILLLVNGYFRTPPYSERRSFSADVLRLNFCLLTKSLKFSVKSHIFPIKFSPLHPSNLQIVDEFWWVLMVTAGSNNQDEIIGDKHSSSAISRGGGRAMRSWGTTASGQSVSTSSSAGSPSTRSEATMAVSPASENTFMRLNHLDIHTDNVGSQAAAG
ncbi:hypothetical protein L2E82_27820 [Cichorium intybus]|uniref:Uncharacterized protein n=1 Tax=Cichorium intybus TaxID=13427 RepID=A0ACB9CU50_CICIN|nr:hypothetical protein L2E82_27820 [Cichorium intybus]